MNRKSVCNNQTEKTLSFCLIVFLFIVFCILSVFYVNAAEIYIGEGLSETNDIEIQDGFLPLNKETEEDAVSAAAFGTTIQNQQLQDQLRIRRANEDAIPVANTITGRYHLSEKEYNILTRIVEAEAGNLDKKSKILVANVVLNRMNHEEFPDTVEEVVFQNVNGAIQFSPIADGRYYTVKVTDSTKESVDRALAGEDYSEGALYFMERSISAASNVSWFDQCLTRLFKYESHEFFK